MWCQMNNLLQFSGEYDIELYSHNAVVKTVSNILTNGFLFIESLSDVFQVQLGTSLLEPEKTDINLNSPFGSKVNILLNNTRYLKRNGQWYLVRYGTIFIPITTDNNHIAEIGLFTTDNILVSHALMKDALGRTIPFSVEQGDVLKITYRILTPALEGTYFESTTHGAEYSLVFPEITNDNLLTTYKGFFSGNFSKLFESVYYAYSSDGARLPMTISEIYNKHTQTITCNFSIEAITEGNRQFSYVKSDNPSDPVIYLGDFTILQDYSFSFTLTFKWEFADE